MARKEAEEAAAKAATVTAAAADEERNAATSGDGTSGTSPQPESAPPLSSAQRVPALFEDEAWEVLNHVILSTR